MKKILLTGHIDHGKSTLGGNLLFQCGAFDEREAQKIFDEAEQDRAASARWARLLDTDALEKKSGITVECNEHDFLYRLPSSAHQEPFRLIDTPGHKVFVPHLIEAVYRNVADGGIVVGVLVLSALPNDLASALERGQVKEDVLLLRAIGIDRIAVALNKMDALGWKEESYESAKKKITPLLKAARFKNIAFAPTSGFEGRGLISRQPLISDSGQPNLPLPSLMEQVFLLASEESLPVPPLATASFSGPNQQPEKLHSVQATASFSGPNQQPEKLHSVQASASFSGPNQQPEKLHSVQAKEEFWANIFVLNCPIFSCGFGGVIHTLAGESGFEVKQIEISASGRPRRPFLKSGEKGKVLLRLEKKMELESGSRIVIRGKLPGVEQAVSGEGCGVTIGYGLVVDEQV